MTYEEFINTMIQNQKLARSFTKKSPLQYYGGKFFIVDEILRLIPPHICYVEVFFGSGQVFFQKERSEVEVINDLDDLVYSFFKVLSDKVLFEQFIKKL